MAKGAALGDRRTPSIALAAHARWQFWDGRADSLWAQALGPLEDAREMASSRVFVARRIAAAHAAEYARAFPDAPLPDMTGWPAEGKPGDAAYDAMSAAEKDAATRVFVRAGKAIAAYERTFRVKPNALDAYLGGDRAALAPLEKYGLSLFVAHGLHAVPLGPAAHGRRLPRHAHAHRAARRRRRSRAGGRPRGVAHERVPRRAAPSATTPPPAPAAATMRPRRRSSGNSRPRRSAASPACRASGTAAPWTRSSA